MPMWYFHKQLCLLGFSSGLVVMIMNVWGDDNKRVTIIDNLCYQLVFFRRTVCILEVATYVTMKLENGTCSIIYGLYYCKTLNISVRLNSWCRIGNITLTFIMFAWGFTGLCQLSLHNSNYYSQSSFHFIWNDTGVVGKFTVPTWV